MLAACVPRVALNGASPCHSGRTLHTSAPRAAPAGRRSSASCHKLSFKVRSTNGSAVELAEVEATPLVKEMTELLVEDLKHLFDDVGVDPNLYDDVVEFRDPITKYDNIQGYIANIKMLKSAFDPEYIMHDVRATGDAEITTRWTMVMKPTFVNLLPEAVRKAWQPQLTFTGVSIMGINPETKRFNRHVDLWDNVTDNSYFSVEAFSDVLSQIFNFQRIPDLETPEYVTLVRKKEYEIRRYPSFLVAEAPMPRATPADGKTAFGQLAGYIFGGNADGKKMAMTTPVYTNDGKMQFVVGSSVASSPDSLPSPLPGSSVQPKAMPGRVFAARRFAGMGDAESATQEAETLRAALVRDGLLAEEGYTLARYNDPSTKPAFRTNDVLIELFDTDDVWAFLS